MGRKQLYRQKKVERAYEENDDHEKTGYIVRIKTHNETKLLHFDWSKISICLKPPKSTSTFTKDFSVSLSIKREWQKRT